MAINMQQIGKILVVIGIILCILGLIFYFAGNKLNFIGRLPGDIRIEKDNFRFYFPITTMILISIIVTIVFKIIKKFF